MSQSSNPAAAQGVAASPLVRSAAPGDDRVLIETRLVGGFIIIVLLLAFVALYVFPAETGRDFSWTISPPLMPMLMGAGYTAGIYFFLRVLTGRWHQVARGFLPITVFTVFMLAATILHWDRFRHGSAQFYLWTIIYIVTPLLVPLLWWHNRGAESSTPESIDYLVPWRVRQLIGLGGALGVAAALIMFIHPQWAIAWAPWKLTLLTARVGAGWAALGASTAISLAADARWSTWRVLIEAFYVGGVLMLLAIIRGWNDLNPANPITWLFVGGLGVMVLIFAAGHMAGDALRRPTS